MSTTGKKIRLGVIFGGQSREHEVSLNSAQSVINVLDKGKYEIIPIAITKKGVWLIGDQGKKYLSKFSGLKQENALSLEKSESFVTIKKKGLTNFAEGEINKKIDLMMPLVHGTFGEDGRLQGMLEMLGLPYLFSDTLASALAMNKPRTQVIVERAGLDVLPHQDLNKNDKYNLLNIIQNLGMPLVVKPAELGSSVGIFIAKTKDELGKSIKKSFDYCDHLMLEEYKNGRELTVGIVGNAPPQALPVLEIIPQVSDFYDYQAKYAEGGSQHVCPAKIPSEIENRIQEDALRAFQAIGCRDVARADFIWNKEDDKIYFLEINTIPGMTSVSLVPEAAEAAGIEFSKFLDILIAEGLKRT